VKQPVRQEGECEGEDGGRLVAGAALADRLRCRRLSGFRFLRGRRGRGCGCCREFSAGRVLQHLIVFHGLANALFEVDHPVDLFVDLGLVLITDVPGDDGVGCLVVGAALLVPVGLG